MPPDPPSTQGPLALLKQPPLASAAYYYSQLAYYRYSKTF